MGLMLEGITAATRPFLDRGRTLLLDYVSGFVGHQAEIGRTFAAAKEDISAVSESTCRGVGCGLLGPGIGVYAHRVEIDLKTAFNGSLD